MPYHKLWRWSKLSDSHIKADCYCISSYETYCKVYSYQYWVNNVRISVKVEQYHALMNIATEVVQQVKAEQTHEQLPRENAFSAHWLHLVVLISHRLKQFLYKPKTVKQILKSKSMKPKEKESALSFGTPETKNIWENGEG